MKPENVKRQLLGTYLAVVRNSVGARTFRNFFADVNGKHTDVMQDGRRSCAFFVSFILTGFGLAKRIHGTVDATIRDLLESGWVVVNQPAHGDVLVWEEKEVAGHWNKHIGFYIGADTAVSNDSKSGVPKKHHWTNKGKRKVEKIFRNPSL